MEKKPLAIKHRVITLLDRPEMDFLDTVSKDAFFTTGHKLSYNEILKGLVDTAMQLGVSGEGMDSLEKLGAQMLRCVEKEKKRE